MKNKYILLTFLLAFLPGTIRAADLDTRISLLEVRMNEASTRTAHGNFGAKTASAAPPLLGENWFFNGEMLWWHAAEGGTDYAQLFEGDPEFTPLDSVKNYRLKFKSDFGFRAGIGKIFTHDRWDLFLNFTWFRTKNSSTASLHGGQFLTPLHQMVPLEASQVKFRWNIHFYTLDLNLGRSYFMSPKIALHPYAGLKTAWISQHVRTKSAIFSPSVETVSTKEKNGFWGIGPQIGIDGKWFLGYGFNLFALGGGSLLWGQFDVLHKEQSSPSRFNTHQISPMAQLQLGIGYETNIYHDKYRIEISARYENQYWWNQNQLPYFAYFSPERFQRYAENLSLQGLTVDARFDF
jgi:hypothetical protein